MTKIYVKEKKILSTDFQNFMQQFVDSCIKSGMKSKYDFFPSYKFHIRSLLCRILVFGFKIKKRIGTYRLKDKKKALLIASNGGMIIHNAFPYFYRYEIVPMLWDVWPHSWPSIYNSIKLLEIKIVFVTVKSVAKQLQKDLGIKAYYIPEGIDTELYNKGDLLRERPYDIIELGRQHRKYHKILRELDNAKLLKGYTASHVNSNGLIDSKSLIFRTINDVARALVSYKVMICFPQIDTNPERAGNVETLTQRYWEAMLSRCVMVGRAPQELINLLGYNPVVEVNWNDAKNQLTTLLANIDNYQELIDRNYMTAKKKSSWDQRVLQIRHILSENNYILD